MKYLEVYRGWQIYLIPEAYALSIQGKLTGELTDRYIAIQPASHQCIDDVTLGSLKSGVNEAQK